MRKLLQVLVVAFALSLLAVYVVYAQRAQNRRLAFDSRAPLATNDSHTSAFAKATNARSASPVVASSSKSRAPVISIPTAAPASTAVPAFLPGSKSAPVFQAQSGPVPAPTNQLSSPSTNRPSRGTL